MNEVVYKVEHDGRIAFNVPLNEEAFFLSGFDSSIYLTELGKVKWMGFRKIRDDLIFQTDWTQMPDSPLTDEKKKVYAEYRQALRDLPELTDNPDDVVWPVKPE